MAKRTAPQADLTAAQLVEWLLGQRDERNREGMKRFGIDTENALGVSVVKLREKAKLIGRNHERSLELWGSGIHEAELLAALTAEPNRLTPEQMDRWVADFTSWDTCDLCCLHLFRLTDYIYNKVYEYAASEREFTRRTAFTLIASLAVGDKKAPNERFTDFFPLIERHSDDPRNFVWKAVNWALRQIGKRNMTLYAPALELARKLEKSPDRTARRIGGGARRELETPKIIARIEKKAGTNPAASDSPNRRIGG